MQLEQLDLFTDYSDRMCPACGQMEGTAYALMINHGYEDGLHHGYQPGTHPVYGEWCDKQALIANHIRYGIKNKDYVMLTKALRQGRKCGLDVESICTAANKEAA